MNQMICDRKAYDFLTKNPDASIRKAYLYGYIDGYFSREKKDDLERKKIFYKADASLELYGDELL